MTSLPVPPATLTGSGTASTLKSSLPAPRSTAMLVPLGHSSVLGSRPGSQSPLLLDRPPPGRPMMSSVAVRATAISSSAVGDDREDAGAGVAVDGGVGRGGGGQQGEGEDGGDEGADVP